MTISEVVQSINLTFRAGLKIMFAFSVAWSKRALSPSFFRLTKLRHQSHNPRLMPVRSSAAWSKRALEPNSLRLTKNRPSRLNRD